MSTDTTPLKVSQNAPCRASRKKRRQWDASGHLNQDVSLEREEARNTGADELNHHSDQSDDVIETKNKSNDVLETKNHSDDVIETKNKSQEWRRDGQYDKNFCVEQDPDHGSFKTIMSELLKSWLLNVQYDPWTCRDLSHNLAGQIMEKIKELRLRQYKYVAIVSIGSQNERSAMHFGSRCLWDEEVDSFATVKFTNSSLFAVAMIYGLHFE